MTQDDYAEAWAWTHFLMESRPETLDDAAGYLADLRRDGVATPLSVRLAAMFPTSPTAGSLSRAIISAAAISGRRVRPPLFAKTGRPGNHRRLPFPAILR